MSRNSAVRSGFAVALLACLIIPQHVRCQQQLLRNAAAVEFRNPLARMSLLYEFGDGHLGDDYDGNEGDAVYAIADGIVHEYYPSASAYGGGGGGTESCASVPGQVLFIRHRKSDGTYFVAQYGHIKNVPPRLQIRGSQVLAGEHIADIAVFAPCRACISSRCDHLHFGWWDSEAHIPSGNWGYGSECVGGTPPTGCWVAPTWAMTHYAPYSAAGVGEYANHTVDAAFVSKYQECAAAAHPLGQPWNNPDHGSVYVHSVGTMDIQDFQGFNNGFDHPYTALIRDSESAPQGEVRLLKEGFWDFWMNHHGWINFGPPVLDEYPVGDSWMQTFRRYGPNYSNDHSDYVNSFLRWRSGNEIEALDQNLAPLSLATLTIQRPVGKSTLATDGVYYAGVQVSDFGQPIELVNGRTYSRFTTSLNNVVQALAPVTLDGNTTIDMSAGVVLDVWITMPSPSSVGEPLRVGAYLRNTNAGAPVTITQLRLDFLDPEGALIDHQSIYNAAFTPGGTIEMDLDVVPANSGTYLLRCAGYMYGVWGSYGAIEVPVHDALDISPTGVFVSAGVEGGPFVPSSIGYVLTNYGYSGLQASVSGLPSWLSSSAGSIYIPARSSVGVSVSVNAAALTQPAGSYSSTVYFTNVSNGSGSTSSDVALNVQPAVPQCSVNTSNLDFDVSEFGTSQEQVFVISNVGTGRLVGSVSESHPEFTVSPGSFDLAAGAQQAIAVTYRPADVGVDSCWVRLGSLCSGIMCRASGPVTGTRGVAVAWGDNGHGECSIPPPNEEFVETEAGMLYSLGLKSDGTIVAWGSNSDPYGNFVGQCNVPEPNSDFAAIKAGYQTSYGIKRDGSVVAWGSCGDGLCNVPRPNVDFATIAAGYQHSLGLKTDGSIVAWGSEVDGALEVPWPNTDFVAVAAGQGHSLGLKADGTIVAWGRNDYGQCEVPLPNSGFIAISARYRHSLALRSNGTIVAWGLNDCGECTVPQPNSDFAGIAAGAHYSLGRKHDGTVVSWGNCYYGQCIAPQDVSDFTAISAGFSHSVGLRRSVPASASNCQASDNLCNRIVVSWTDNSSNEAGFLVLRDGVVVGATGAGVTKYTDYQAIASHSYCVVATSLGGDAAPSAADAGVRADVPASAPVAVVASTDRASAVVVSWAWPGPAPAGFEVWRDGVFAYRGTGAEQVCWLDPTPEPGVTHHYAVRAYNDCGNGPLSPAAAGSRASGAPAGSVAMWGRYHYGETDVPPASLRLSSISAGAYHSLGLRVDGSIVAWGNNDWNQCDVPYPNTGFVAVSAGRYHSLGLKADGSIVAWGNNFQGQCTLPVPNSGFVAVAVGGIHSLGLKSDGSIIAWGDNGLGACDVPEPNSGFTAIAGGEFHSVALRSDGSVAAWGYDYYGQNMSPSPNEGFVAVAVGESQNLALREDGVIIAWGDNGWGQCEVPVPNVGFVSIAAGYGHSLGLKCDGSIVAWGKNNDFAGNYSGQCDVAEPNSGFTAVEGGLYYSLGLRSQSVAGVAGAPLQTRLGQNHPNPFNPSTTVDFEVVGPGLVEMQIFDLGGRLVRSLLREYRDTGTYQVTWDGTDDQGRQLPAAVYCCRMAVGPFREVRLLTLVK